MAQADNSQNTRLMVVAIIVLTALSSIGLTMAFSKGSSGSAAGVDRAEVEKIIAETITKNPQIIVEAFTKGRQGEEERMLQDAKKNIGAKQKELTQSKTSPVEGNKNGDVTLVEFFDYNCGYCKKVTPTVKQLVSQDKNIRVVHKNMPILGPTSEVAARAALAVYGIAPAKYMQFHEKLMQTSPVSDEKINALAAEIGISQDKLRKEMQSDRVSGEIAANRELAQSIGIRGTPAFVIGAELIPGAVDIDTLQAKVSAAR